MRYFSETGDYDSEILKKSNEENEKALDKYYSELLKKESEKKNEGI